MAAAVAVMKWPRWTAGSITSNAAAPLVPTARVVSPR